jgi:hypothetical protein
MQIENSTLQWLCGSLSAALVTLLVATWRTGRMSAEAERRMLQADTLQRENAELREYLFGNKLAVPPRRGFVEEVQEARDASAFAARVCRLVFRAFQVDTTMTDKEIVNAIRDSVNGAGVNDTGLHPAAGRLPPMQPSAYSSQRPAPALQPRRRPGPALPREDPDDE